MDKYLLSVAAAALATALCVAIPGVAAGGEPHIEPRWDAGSLVAGISGSAPGTAAEFTRVLSARWDHELRLEVRRGRIVEDVTIADCAALLRIPWKTMWKSKDEPVGTVRDWYVTCAAIERMPRAKASTRTLLPLVLEPLLADLASAKVLVGPRQDKAFFAALKNRTQVRCITERRCLVSTPTDDYAIDLLAVGDFDGDRVEDVMGEASAGPVAGTAVSTRGFIATRLTAGGPLRLIEWW